MTVSDGLGADRDSHVLLLYRDETQRRASVVAWVKQGLDLGEKVFYATAPGEAALPGLATGGAMTTASHDGQLTFVPLDEFFPGAGQAALVRQALDQGFPGVRLSAHADAALRVVGEEVYQAIDRGMDELCASLPVSALCQYGADADGDRGGVDARLGAAIDSHPDALQDARLQVWRHGNEVLMAGEPDVGSADVITRTFYRICQLQGVSDLVVDLSGLTFADVAICRALLAGTQDHRRAGGAVHFRGASGHLRKVLSLLGVPRLSGVVVLE
jgi:anti-anti-sigma regulatory factor